MNIEPMRVRPYRSFRIDDGGCPRRPRNATGRSRRTRSFGRRVATRLARWRNSASADARCTGGRPRSRLAAGAVHGAAERALLLPAAYKMASLGAPKSTRPHRVRRRAYKPRDVKAVLALRRKYPFMGKARIQAMPARKGCRPSVSTAGRIIERAIKAGAIRRASFCIGLQPAGG